MNELLSNRKSGFYISHRLRDHVASSNVKVSCDQHYSTMSDDVCVWIIIIHLPQVPIHHIWGHYIADEYAL